MKEEGMKRGLLGWLAVYLSKSVERLKQWKTKGVSVDNKNKAREPDSVADVVYVYSAAVKAPDVDLWRTPALSRMCLSTSARIGDGGGRREG